MWIRWLHVLLFMVVAGCEKSRLPREGEDVTSKAVSETVSTDQPKLEQIEAVLARDLREVPSQGQVEGSSRAGPKKRAQEAGPRSGPKKRAQVLSWIGLF